MDKITYQKAGVDYSKIDPLKLLAQKAARATAGNLASTGYSEVEASRGESAYVVDMGDFYLASITECLGTKVLVADAMYKLTGELFYGEIAQDTIAAAVNDLITVGASPVSIHAYWATGSSDWFTDQLRLKNLVDGWRSACDLSSTVWGGGETPSLAGVVNPETIDLAASCLGVVDPKERLTLGQELQASDRIVLLSSSGIHANGVSFARQLAGQLGEGYATPLQDGRSYGSALLAPTTIYSTVIKMLFDAGIDIHYMSNITGHGWRKIMRHPGDFTYRIQTMPPVPAVLDFMTKQAGISLSEAYGTFNMGAGFALFIPAAQAFQVVDICRQMGLEATNAGVVQDGTKQVVIEPIDISYSAESLNLRA